MSPAEKLRYQNMAAFGFGPLVMMRTRVCANCARMVEGRGRNCPGCGEKLPRETLFDRYKRRHISCPDCGTVLAADSRYCPHCGVYIQPPADGCENDTSKGGNENAE